MPNAQMSAIHAALDEYVNAGFIVMPLSGKVPVLKGWRHLQYEFYPDLSKFYGNFGVVLQKDDLIIDVDPRNFKSGVNSLLALEKTIHHALDQTMTVRTGSGGYHIYLKKPEHIHIRKTLNDYPGIEFKTIGQQVVGYSCIHPDTKQPYTLEHGTLFTIHRASDSLLNLIKKTAPVFDTGTQSFQDDDQTIGRYISFLENTEPAIQGEHGDQLTFKVACEGKDLGLSPQTTFLLLEEHYNPRCVPPWHHDHLMDKVENAYKYGQTPVGAKHPKADFTDTIFDQDDEESIKWDFVDPKTQKTLRKTLYNCLNHFKLSTLPLKGLFAYDEFTSNIIFTRPAPWHKKKPPSMVLTDEDIIKCKAFLSCHKFFDVPVGIVHEAIIVTSHKNTVHPVREFLSSLKWDGTQRLNTWLHKYLEAENTSYTQAVGRKTLLAAIARIMKPGCKFDQMLVLEGPQDLGKSRSCAILGGSWYGDLTIDTSNKDTVDVMRGKWIVEMSEMETHRRTDTQALKAFLSRQVDRVRLAYARVAKDFPRQSIFIGTINPEQDIGYLKDTTGNRRFWPVAVGCVDQEALARDRDQLLAEAVHLYKTQKEPLFLEDDHIRQIAVDEQAKRHARDPWHDQIRDWLDQDDYGKEHEVVTGIELWHQCLSAPLHHFSRREQARISDIMKELGWQKGMFYHPEQQKTVSGYRRPDF